MKKNVQALLLVSILFLTGCANARYIHIPNSFLGGIEPTWATIEWREGIDYDKTWQNVFDLLAKRFYLEKWDKENGYIMTDWYNGWTGRWAENYRVKVAVLFHKNIRTLEIRTEAHYFTPSTGWVVGVDTKLVETLKGDIMGAIGRTTR